MICEATRLLSHPSSSSSSSSALNLRSATDQYRHNSSSISFPDVALFTFNCLKASKMLVVETLAKILINYKLQ